VTTSPRQTVERYRSLLRQRFALVGVSLIEYADPRADVVEASE